MPDTPNLSMPELVEGQAQGEITHNEALLIIDALGGTVALIEDVTNTPPSHSAGKVWITGGAPTGDWTGQANKFAISNNSQWDFTTPRDKQLVKVRPGATFGVGVWQWDASGTTLIPVDGLYLSKFLRENQLAITASTTQTQGQQPLTKTWSFVDTVANANDVVTLESAAAGRLVTVFNRGANVLQVFPASGDFIDDAAVDTSILVGVGLSVSFYAADNAKWRTTKKLDVNAMTTFIGLTDVPATFTGQARKKVRVNVAENALEFVSDQKLATFQIEANANYGNYRVLDVTTNSEQRFSFIVPDDFGSLVSLDIIAAPATGAHGSGKDVDLFSDYGADGESTTIHQESDTTSTYQIAPNADEWGSLDISSVFSAIAAGDRCGVLVDHNGVGGDVHYLRTELVYIPI